MEWNGKVPQEDLEDFLALATSLKVNRLMRDLSETNDRLQFANTGDPNEPNKKDKEDESKQRNINTRTVDKEHIKLEEVNEEKCTKFGNVKKETIQIVEFSKDYISDTIASSKENESF